MLYTASIYRNEVEIGEAIQESGIPRKDLFITSKASPAEHGAIGVSNYTERHLRQMLPDCQVAPMVNQVEVHPYLLQAGLRAFCAQNGIAVAAYSPLGCGQLLADPTVAAVAAEHTCTLAQALLCWGLQHGLVVIAKSVKPERIKENIGAFSFELGSNSVSVLDALDKGHHFCWCSEGVV
eukprot:jgi/Mesen1/4202/ME000219S03337